MARLTGARNVLPGVAHRAPGGGCDVTLADGLVLRAQAAGQGAVAVVVRADGIVLRAAGASGSPGCPGPAPAAVAEGGARPADNIVTACVVAARDTATGCLISLDAGALTALVPRAYRDGRSTAPGTAVELVIPAASVHVIPDHR